MSYRITIQPSGHEFTADPGESILDAALRHDISLPYGCRSGKCGSCETTLVSGAVTYPYGEPESLADKPGAILACSTVPAGDLVLRVNEIASVAQIQVRILPCKVDRVDRLADDVVRLMLKLPEEQRLQYLAGQYLDFILEDGRKRAFSIANAPHDDERIELHIRHVDGGEFTDYVFNQLHEKDMLRIEAPLGGFFLREDSDRPIVLMGGGTGFAPLKAMIEHAFHIGVKRPMHLYWGVRARRDLYMPDLPQQWMREHTNFRFIPVLSEPDKDWVGRTGWVHQAVVDDHPNLKDMDLYMSGPPVMINAGKEAFLAAGLSMDHMYSDAFEYAADSPRKAKQSSTG